MSEASDKQAMFLDHSVYLDLNPADRPDTLETIYDRADYVHRICSAWDFHIHPEPETFKLFSEWRDVFDQFPLVLSPAYHAFRAWFGWPVIPNATGLPGPTPLYVHLDGLEGRPDDPCENMI